MVLRKQLQKKLLNLVLVLATSFSSVAVAQQRGMDDEETAAGPRRQLATIIFAGLGGAILGLSTLSFYGRPQDHLSNIAVGFAIGVIGGTGYVTFKAATSPAEFYGLEQASFHQRKSADLLLAQQGAVRLVPVVYRLTF